jgi:hypothetical protein
MSGFGDISTPDLNEIRKALDARIMVLKSMRRQSKLLTDQPWPSLDEEKDRCIKLLDVIDRELKSRT